MRRDKEGDKISRRFIEDVSESTKRMTDNERNIELSFVLLNLDSDKNSNDKKSNKRRES